MNFLGAARSRDEEEDLKDFATTGHGQNVCHPCADPFEVLRRLNDPDQGKPTGGGCTVGVSGNDLANLRNLMRDADTSSPKHDCTVGTKVLTTCKMTLACVVSNV